MSIPLVTLALDAEPVLATAYTDGCASEGAREVHGIIQRHLQMAREDARSALEERRQQMDELLSAQERRMEAIAAGDVLRRRQAEVFMVECRANMERAQRSAVQARSECDFAEMRAVRAEKLLRGRPELAGRALRTFALERIRQLDEISGMWSSERPERDRIFVDELRRCFESMCEAANAASVRSLEQTRAMRLHAHVRRDFYCESGRSRLTRS